MQGFRGNCGFPGKLGMCPSLAEPDSGGIPKSNLHTLAKSEAILPNHTQSVSQESNNNKHTKEDSHNRNPLFLHLHFVRTGFCERTRSWLYTSFSRCLVLYVSPMQNSFDHVIKYAHGILLFANNAASGKNPISANAATLLALDAAINA